MSLRDKLYWAYLRREYVDIYGFTCICVPHNGEVPDVKIFFRIGRYVCIRKEDIDLALSLML